MVRRTEVGGLEARAFAAREWARRHSRAIAAGALVLVVAGAGGWLYKRSQELKEERASSALMAAEQSVAAGNVALAQSDLEKLVRRYEGTVAARQATLRLAHILYDKGQFEPAVTQLEQLASRVKDPDIKAVIEDQIAAGYEEMGKFAEAAEHYTRAAQLARFPADSANHLASAARAYTTAGNVAQATRIWTELAADPSGPVAAEARVRLGELTVRPARSSGG